MRKAKTKRVKSFDPELMAILNDFEGPEQTLGCVKATAYINYNYGHLGHWYNHKKVYRHMKELDILQPKQVKKPKKRPKTSVVWSTPIKSNLRWEADLTYVSNQHGNMYLFTVIDVFDKEIIGEHFSYRCRAIDAVKSIESAVLKRFSDGLIPDDFELTLRLDRGCQYTSEEFGKYARKMNLKLEFCDVQAPNQKPYIESFFANFKREEVYRNEYLNPIQAVQAWKSYIDWYNFKRPHGSIRNLSPVQFRRQIKLESSLILT